MLELEFLALIPALPISPPPHKHVSLQINALEMEPIAKRTQNRSLDEGCSLMHLHTTQGLGWKGQALQTCRARILHTVISLLGKRVRC
jgi:hypothetical protein